jgi:hypothetical protein
VTLASNLCQTLRRLQQRLEGLYGLEAGPHVCQFVRLDPDCAHETVLARISEDATLELMVLLPQGIDPDAPPTTDEHLQLIEGISHFVHLSERARTELPTTELELELQAEVDKFALLRARHGYSNLSELHRWLFEQVTFLHPEQSTRGERYRLANDLAARLWARLVERDDESFTRQLLYRFYRLGQTEKLSLIATV